MDDDSDIIYDADQEAIELQPLNGRSQDMPEKKNFDDDEEDVISQAIGDYGRWQLQLTFLLSLVNIPCTWHIFSPTFLAKESDIWCARTENFSEVPVHEWKEATQPAGACTIRDLTDVTNLSDILFNATLTSCTKWEFAEMDLGETLISEFSLLCDRKYLNNVAEMMFLAGVAIGGFICGIISDKFGRKKTLMGSVFIQAVLGTLLAVIPWFELYFILRAILGFISVSVVFSGFVLSIELVGGHWRTVAGIAYLFPVSVGYAMIAGLGWLVREWRYLELVVSLPGLLILGLWWVIPESPRWLLAMGRTKEVKKILERAAIVNGKQLPEHLDKLLSSANKSEQEPEVSVLDLFRTPRMRKITLLLSVVWFTVYLIYYGIVLNVASIGGDIYLNSFLSGLVEVPALAISIVFVLKIGRKYPLALTILFAGVACFLEIPIKVNLPNLQWPVTALSMMGKFLISSSNAVMPVFTAELYPTTMRNLGVGASNVSAGIALMLVPYLYETEHLHASLPLATLGIFGIVGGACVFFLPETGNGPLKDTLIEQEEKK